MYHLQELGKTTLLRDAVKSISDGFKGFIGQTVGVVDERGEISAMARGIIQNDIGVNTDVINNVPKALGMTMLVRSMGPQIIVADEIGSKEDFKAINYAVCSGVKGIFTAHGNSIDDLKLNPIMQEMLNRYIFERIIILNGVHKKGEIKQIYNLNPIEKKYILGEKAV